MRGAAQLPTCGADGADAVGQVFAVGVADRQYRDVVDTVVIGVGDRRRGERVTGLTDRVVFVFPAVLGADLLAGVDVASAETRERVTFGRILLPAILGEHRDWKALNYGEAREFADEPAGGDRLCLVHVTHTPELRVRAPGPRCRRARRLGACRVVTPRPR